MGTKQLIEVQEIKNLIFIIRGQRVMFDADLAKLYGVTTKRLNEQVRRNAKRFPSDFMLQITQEEYDSLRCQIGTLKKNYGGRRYLPYAFTEQGIAMLSSVLNSDRAIEVNIRIMRAFVQMRQVLFSQKEGLEKLADLERIQKIHGHLLHEHNDNIAIIFEAIRRLEEMPDEEKKKIGFMR